MAGRKKHPHGTRACGARGCKKTECRAAYNAWQRARRRHQAEQKWRNA